MEERGLVGLEARSGDGTVFGRISEVVADERSGEVTHVVVERDGERLEVPISAVTLDPGADFATVHADRSDVEPADHLGDEERPAGYAPSQSEAEDREHEGQFVSEPQDQSEAASLEAEESTEAAQAGGWEDEGSTTADSGYPRNDAYIDPDTGEEVSEPLTRENETLADDVEDLLAESGLEVRSARDGVVELSGSAGSRDELRGLVDEISGLDGVREVDTTDVDVG